MGVSMQLLGTALILVGITGAVVKTWEILREATDPLKKCEAEIAKIRLDTKKADGKEDYTYVATFYIYELGQYLSLNVSQTQFDEMLDKDKGLLSFYFKRRRFVGWKCKRM